MWTADELVPPCAESLAKFHGALNVDPSETALRFIMDHVAEDFPPSGHVHIIGVKKIGTIADKRHVSRWSPTMSLPLQPSLFGSGVSQKPQEPNDDIHTLVPGPFYGCY